MSMYLTFDIGTTSLKTALISDSGLLLAVHVEEYTPMSPRSDWTEMRPDDYWNAAVKGTRSVMSSLNTDPSEISAIGFSSQGQTFIPIDERGNPLYNAIVWVDNRAQPIADEWEASWLTREEYKRITGFPNMPAALTIFKLGWLSKNRPELMKAYKFLCLPDYMIYSLTGETVTDHNIALMGGAYDINTSDWSAPLLDAAGVKYDQMPTLLNQGSIAGTLLPGPASELGIYPGIPVCVGANDQQAGAVGAGNVRPGIVTETTGTALAVVATTPTLLEEYGLCVGAHAVPGRYYALAFTITSAIVLKWFRDMCTAGMSYEEFLSGVENIQPGCGGLAVLPHFAGTGTPDFNPNERGAFIGLTLNHTRSHIARAIMESCACMLRECLEPIIKTGLELKSVRSLGGAARSDVWLQMKADMLGIPVERPACSDAASLGAAVLAAVGTGEYESIEEASDAWYRTEQVFEPDASAYSAYQEVFDRYTDLRKRLF